jgi:hypothetical protein
MTRGRLAGWENEIICGGQSRYGTMNGIERASAARGSVLRYFFYVPTTMSIGVVGGLCPLTRGQTI